MRIRMGRLGAGTMCAVLAAGGIAATTFGTSGVAGASGKGKGALTIGIGLSLQGETSYAVNSYYYGTEFAIQELNKKGGVDGKKIKYFRVPTPIAPTAMGSALLQIGAKHPDLIVGFDSPTTAAITRQINEVGIPLISQVSMPSINGYPAGSKWVFQEFSSTSDYAKGPVAFAKQYLHAKSVAVLHTNNTFGTAGSKFITTDLKATGITESTDTAYAQTATSMTQPVLAAAGSDAVIDWGYPAPLAVQVNLMKQNGSNEPTIGPLSVGTDVASGAIKKTSFTDVYTVGYCNPAGSKAANVVAFDKAYTTEFATPATQNAALGYDSVLFGVAAAEKATSFSPTAIRAALLKEKLTTGVCSTDYYSNKAQVLMHEDTIVGYNATGAPVTKATYKFSATG